jgi:hypothetical protein
MLDSHRLVAVNIAYAVRAACPMTSLVNVFDKVRSRYAN